MIKKLNITALLIMLMLVNQLFAQSDKILIYGNCSIDQANKLSEYLKNTSYIDLEFEINDETFIDNSRVLPMQLLLVPNPLQLLESFSSIQD